MHRPHTGVGTEIARAIDDHLAGDGDLGEGVSPVHLDIGKAFVVLQAHVVSRAVTLDQVHLQNQRFQLRADHDPLDVGDLAHQFLGFGVFMGAGMEVGAHPRAQIDRLAHVDDAPLRILHQVAPGLIGQRVQDRLEMFVNLHTGLILAHPVSRAKDREISGRAHKMRNEMRKVGLNLNDQNFVSQKELLFFLSFSPPGEVGTITAQQVH